jgi:hypothetical protein
MSMRIVLAEEDHEIQSCYHVMAELRPHVMADEFLQRVKRDRLILRTISLNKRMIIEAHHFTFEVKRLI